MEFEQAFNTAEELVRRTISDFLWSHHQKKEPTTKGIIGMRSTSLDFQKEILPILRLLCPSIRPVSCYTNNEEKPQYVLNWDEGTLVVPEFVIEESDRHFDNWISMLEIGDDEPEEEKDEVFDPYTMVPLEMF